MNQIYIHMSMHTYIYIYVDKEVKQSEIQHIIKIDLSHNISGIDPSLGENRQ